MGKLVIDRGNFTDLTSVSNLFIDEYMPNANGEFVKIYLYLLRLVSGHSTEITTDALADLLCFTESDVGYLTGNASVLFLFQEMRTCMLTEFAWKHIQLINFMLNQY